MSESTIRMDGGMGWFRVPGNARGFTVRTEYGQVVDLGTEFGILFDAQDKLQVHVAHGRVRVIPSSPDEETKDLTGGKAMRFDPEGNSEPQDIRASLFRREFAKQVPHIHWTFNQLADGVFRASGTLPGIEEYGLRPQRTDGADVSPAEIRAEGMYGGAFSLKGDGLFAESAFPGIEGHAPRTVAAWVRQRGTWTAQVDTTPAPGWVPTPFGAQGRYSSNTGISSADDTIGALTAGTTITLSFDAVTDGYSSGDDINAYLVLYNGGLLNDFRTTYDGSSAVLAKLATDNITTTSYQTFSFSYIVGDPVFDNNGATAGTATTWLPSLLGQDIGIRFEHKNDAIIDNASVSIIPEPTAALLGSLGLLALLRRRR